MADFKVNVTADTQDAERKLQSVDKTASEATRNRQIKIDIPNYSELSKNFKDLNKDIESAANSVKQFYRISSQLPIGPVKDINEMAGQLKRVATTASETSRGVMDAGDVIKATFATTNKAAETLVSRLTRIALSLYVIQEAAGAVQSAFGGLFKETIGREVKLRETILKTQTTLASTNKVFKNGNEITDPYQKIVQLTGAVRQNIDSIRERSIALAGVTSNEVIEVFGIVATQIGQIGGGLKDAEDLAINFAAALGTFGIPLYQARQEIGSILRGDITMDSYLAKALGITNDDIAKAKGQAGGVIKFLEDRLAASVAGQRIAAEGFSGVVSNIRDLGELVGQNFGAGLLDPLIGGLTTIFDFLFKIRNQIFDISRLAGTSIGTVASMVIGLTSGASGGFRQTAGGGGGSGSRGTVDRRSKPELTSNLKAEDVLKGVEKGIKKIQLEVGKAISTVYLQIATLTERIANAFSAVSKGLANLAMGLLSLKLEQLKAVIGVIESLSPALLTATKAVGGFLSAWGEVLKLPLVQQLSQIATGMRLLEVSGVMPLIRTGFILQGVIANWGKIIGFVREQFNMLRAIIGGVIAWLGQLITQAGRSGVALLTAWQPAGKALQALRAELLATVVQLETVGNSAQRAGNSIGGFGQNIEKAGGGIKTLILGMIKFNLIMFAISAALSIVIERFSAWKETQDKVASDRRAQEAIRRLSTTYKDLGENATESQKRAKAFEQSLVNQEYDKAVEGLEKIKKKLEEVRDAFGPKEGFGANLKKGVDNILATLNPANIDILGKQLRGDYVGTDITSFGEAVERRLLERRKAAALEVAKYGKEVDRIAAEENIKIESQNRVNLEKEIGELRKQQEDQIFQLRQSLAQKEVEIFRAAGELRLLQMEQANKKLIEGEEGASAAALESLNNYLSIRERGELDIEAAKKEIVIEATNLEKQISDYRLENEKKIAEIRKRAGDYEQKVADYRRQQAAATGAAPGVSAGFLVGSTGRSSGPHLDLRSPTGDKQSVINEAVAIIKAWQQQNLAYIELSNAKIDVKNMTDEGQLRAALAREQQVHGRRSGGGAIDIAVPAGTLVPMPVGTPSWGGDGGWQATSLQTGNLYLHGLENSTATPGAKPGAPAAPIAPPKAPTFDDIGAPAVAKYAAAVRSLTGAMERLRALQAALTEAKTAVAFEEIAKAAFPKVALEQYDDQLKEAQITLDAIAASSAEAYDPELLRLAVDEKTKIAIQEREIKEIYAKAVEQRRSGNLTEAELQKLKEDLLKKQDDYVKKLAAERKLREQVLDITKQQSAIEDLRKARTAIPFDLQRAGLQATNTMAGAFNGEDPVRQRQLEAEVRIAERRIQLEQDRTKSSEQVRAELAQFALETRAAATVLGELDIAVRDFQQDMVLIRESARTFTEGFKGFFKSILSGGDISGALTSMLESVADRFLSMALDAAFAPVEQMMTQMFKDFFGVEDPMASLEAANTTALTSNTNALTPNTAAIVALTTAIGTAAASAAAGAAAPNTGGAEGAAGATDAATEAAAAANAQAEATENSTEATKKATSGLGQFQNAMGSVMSMAAGVASIAGGIGMMKKGGTYNTLMGLAGIFGGIGSVAGGVNGLFKARGGPISANRPYIVGEKGPELIIPQANGTVLPNNYLRGGGSAAASQLPAPSYIRQVPEGGTAVAPMEAAVAAASTANSRLEFSYESTVINNVEYVTSEQFQRGMSDAAERGRALTLKSLQNSVRTRKRVGI